MVVIVSVNMDVSPLSAKSSGSDFSIERILSDERRKEDSDAPSWLCCTRYQPPRIPRPASSNGARARRSGRHARVPFTAAQAAALEAAYARAPYLAPPALRALAAALQLRDDRIKIWFQNRRARERREKSGTIAPPHSVPLPPTTIPQGAFISSNIPWNIHPNIEVPAITNQRVNYFKVEEPQDLSSSTMTVPGTYSQNSSFSEGSDEDRSESPLDVETVEE